MKKILVAMSMALAATTANAQFDLTPNIGVGVSAGIVTGIGIDASITMTDFLGARVGYNWIPKFKYSTDLDVTGVTEGLKSNEYYKYSDPQLVIPEKISVEGKLNMSTWHVLFDVYPLGAVNSFHLTVGAYFGADDIVSVYNKEDGALNVVNQFNAGFKNGVNSDHIGKYTFNYKDYPTTPAGPKVSGTQTVDNVKQLGVELGDYFLQPTNEGNLSASIKVKKFRPYVGLGFGRAVPKNRVGVQFDLGCQFWGSPEVYCYGKDANTGQNTEMKLDETNTGSDGGKILKTISKVSVCPVLKLRIVGKIF
ncbi:hypothetical protein [Prevotella sp. E13-27]|jgi:hypothetical protein|uniref:hypothetical protein n=1 Tax=Prevotella sp. E13-27 TaxID=2938122 RepID=UPI002009FBF2|nr:hypothetical protein [Prevotella sp. E13-27]MCK8620928.1 hypothetical protein [Prevotella sp. E13-27]